MFFVTKWLINLHDNKTKQQFVINSNIFESYTNYNLFHKYIKQMSTTLKIHEHLFEIYPAMPKYAADPSESEIIRIYDHIMLRFAGHYGRQP